MNIESIMKMSRAATRSVTAENVYGKKGRGGMAEFSAIPQPDVAKIGQKWEPNPAADALGRTWKVRPCITIPKKTTTTIMEVDGPGVIQHLWCTLGEQRYRDVILRMYWDGERTPSVEAPIGDFFCNGWKTRVDVLALPINVNPSGGFNCYFPMPFRRHAKITLENRADKDSGLFYAINYALTKIGKDDAYFHAQFRRVNPTPYKQDYVILDGVRGRGHYVGTYLAWQQNSPGWWGEGEFKAFIDGDRTFPTLCGTGTEDYFGGAWGFGRNFSAPFLGYPLGECDGGIGNRHGLYRFHIPDPIRFSRNLKVTIQALGWDGSGKYRPLRDDIASTAYWYQTEPHIPFPKLPNRRELEVEKCFWQSDFINTWRISKLLPKKNGIASAPPVTLKRNLGWRTIEAVSGFADAHSLYGQADGMVYFAAEVTANKSGRWILAVGHDGGVRVFVDGKPVLTETARVNPAVPDRSKVEINLTKGNHSIVSAFDTDGGMGCGIFVRFHQPASDRKPGVAPAFPASNRFPT